LAWWRERLEDLDQGKTAPAEPRLQAVASELLNCGITGTALSQLEDAWLPLLDAFPWANRQSEGLKLRGRILFGIGARLLGGEASFAEPAGELWSLIDGALHCSDQASRTSLLKAAQSTGVERKVPAKLRPMTIIAAVAVANVRDPASGVARGMAATLHRLTGGISKL
jgi:phytoene synthase